MLIGLTMVIISQHTHVSKHHIVCLKYIQFLFVKYTSIKLEKNKVIWVSAIQSNWCPFKKRRLGHRHVEREGHGKMQGEDSHIQVRERGCRRNQLC